MRHGESMDDRGFRTTIEQPAHVVELPEAIAYERQVSVSELITMWLRPGARRRFAAIP